LAGEIPGIPIARCPVDVYAASLLRFGLLAGNRSGFTPCPINSLVCSLTTLFASLSQRSPTNFECRSRSAIFLSPELPQMVIYVEIGMPHALGPRHLPKHPVRSELALGTTEALK
jgi:hypothetical protein